MSTVKSLRKSILKLDPDVDYQGLDKKGLSTLLEKLRAANPSDDSDGLDELDLDDELNSDDGLDSDDDADDDADEQPIASKSVVFKICMGKAITTRRGVLSDGDSVSSSDFASEQSFDNFLKKGFIEGA